MVRFHDGPPGRIIRSNNGDSHTVGDSPDSSIFWQLGKTGKKTKRKEAWTIEEVAKHQLVNLFFKSASIAITDSRERPAADWIVSGEADRSVLMIFQRKRLPDTPV